MARNCAPARMPIPEALRSRARALGFDAIGIANISQPWPAAPRLLEYLDAGHHGDMDWLAETATRRAHPQALWPEAQSAVMLGLSYAPGHDPLALLAERGFGLLSAYAARRDYHDVIKGRLKQLARFLQGATGQGVKVFVDTAPLMEKPLAQMAGLGWQGKHTNLVSRTHGSWLLLGAILTQAHLRADRAEGDHCGQCRACLDVCPTAAFPAPYRLDARRCLAYLTIEHKGPIPREFRAAMGNRIFGCDDCLAVCPWNKFAQASSEAKIALRADLLLAPLDELARLDDAAFRARFAGTPVKRTGRDRFVRNVLMAMANSGNAAFSPIAQALLQDHAAPIRGAAVWACTRLLDPETLSRLKAQFRDQEPDEAVRAEWDAWPDAKTMKGAVPAKPSPA